ncbi:hypothetical protein HWD99_17975 [Microbacterium sp. C5A9]|uniref:hypothetical protein n=1 Tax=Microbacterium sp. C5A9 TaxID=2736663 RepID=UPI001F51CFBC|nr:hypothetical protein [Microbacterium sp. C5A9]MCI1020519.1 hypothetical protein [Microbacterium sp. C5A9]
MTDAAARECFIAMPITVHLEEKQLYRDADHWKHVMEQLFIPAIELAGFSPIKPFTTGSDMIHARIVQYLATAPLVLCDLSQHNANVMFELGVRTSVDKPIVLVKDEQTKLPFDIGGINTYEYSSGIESWRLEQQREELADHIRETGTRLDDGNPMWRRFGTGIVASAPSSDENSTEARLDVISEQVFALGELIRTERRLSMPASTGVLVASISDFPGVIGVRLSSTADGTSVFVETVNTPKEDQWIRGAEIEQVLADLNTKGRVIETTSDLIILRLA